MHKNKNKGKVLQIIKKSFTVKGRDRAPSQVPNGKNDNLPPQGKTLENDKFKDAKPPVFPHARQAWLDVTAEEVAQDLHRLIFRTTVETGVPKKILLSPPDSTKRDGPVSSAKAVCSLVNVLSESLESPEESQKINDLTEELMSSVDVKSDLIKFTSELLEHLGEESKITKILKCFHQSIISAPYTMLCMTVTKNKFTRDVRGDDGWQVVITLGDRHVQVKHVRKDQSVDMPTRNQPDKTKNHWEYQWQLSMTFDGEMKDMTQSRLSITSLTLSEGMDPELEKDLKFMMQDGSLLVY